MKKVRIHISKLGPIVDQEIELAQLMLFTGDSNLGKSYTNFLCYYLFKWLRSIARWKVERTDQAGTLKYDL